MDHPTVKKGISKLTPIFAAALFFVQCESPHYYQELRSTGGNWEKNTPLDYEFEISDTAALYDFYLLSRNNNRYPYSNLYLITEFSNPAGEKFNDTLQYFLSFPDGEWIGDGNSLKELFLLYRENISFKDTGNYKLKVWQGMREDQLAGIEDLSLIVDKKEKDGKTK